MNNTTSSFFPRAIAKALISAATVLSLASGGNALAQDSRDRNAQRHWDEQGQQSYQHDQQGDQGRAQNSHGDRNHANRNEHRDERGAGPNHSFHRGDRLPSEYRSRQYVVNDWRGHRLSAPPHGYHWVQVGNDYVLAAIATGVISQLLLNNY